MTTKSREDIALTTKKMTLDEIRAQRSKMNHTNVKATSENNIWRNITKMAKVRHCR